MSHVSPDFVPVFGDCIRMIRQVGLIPPQSYLLTPRVHSEVLFTEDAQPFLISGSGTLGWDQVCSFLIDCPAMLTNASRDKVASNLVEPGENVLVLHSGYFGDSFTDW